MPRDYQFHTFSSTLLFGPSPSPRASRSCRSASERCRRRATSPTWTPIARSWMRLSDRVTRTSLRARDLESAIEKYLEDVGSARLDRSEPIEDDEQAQAELASDLSEAFADLHPIGRPGGKELQPIGVLRRPTRENRMIERHFLPPR